MSTPIVDSRYRPMQSFSGSVQNVDIMASSSYHSASGAQSSYHSSITDDDLEEARQRLLAHQFDQEPEESPIKRESPIQNDLYQREVANGRVPSRVAQPTVAVERPSTNDSQSRVSRYGSVSTYHSNQKKAQPMKRYRLPLLILLGFDWGLVVFLSIICFVLLRVNNEAMSYWDLNINVGFFDLVIIATTRTILNILVYTLLGWVTRIVMAVTTVVSACYVPLKTFYLLSDKDNLDNTVYLIALLMLVFVCFVIPWFIAFFFEFKYLPSEKARLHIPTWWTILPWVWPRAYVINEQDAEVSQGPEHPSTLPIAPAPVHRRGMSASTVTLDFRTPIGSSRASPVGLIDRFGEDDLPPISEEDPPFTEVTSPECDQDLSPEDLMIRTEGTAAMESMMEITRNNDGWTLDKTSNGIKCYTKQIDGRKVLKLDGFVEVSARNLWSILYPGDQTPNWNTSCGVNETIHRVDQTTEVVYTTSNAMGPISSRDFVSARKIAYRDGAYYSTSKSIVTNLRPEQNGRVRGDNGPNGFVVIPVNSSRCQFIWVYNSNLRGWLPQTVVDQTVSTALIGAYQQLQVYARERTVQRNHP